MASATPPQLGVQEGATVENLNVLLTRIEQARLWAYFHKDWLLAIRSRLRPQLPPDYHLFVESEAILISPDEGGAPAPWLPDNAVSRSEPARTAGGRESPPAQSTAAVIEVEESCEIDIHYSLVIRRAPENLVVAVLEIRSPSNKGSGNRFDEEKHLRKRRNLLDAGVQLLEIDALLLGRSVLPAPLTEKLSEFSRVAWTAAHLDARRKYRGWGWNDADALPSIVWIVDRNVEVSIDLPHAMEQAVAFNRWSDLVASAER
jgi:hypothetical protein